MTGGRGAGCRFCGQGWSEGWPRSFRDPVQARDREIDEVLTMSIPESTAES